MAEQKRLGKGFSELRKATEKLKKLVAPQELQQIPSLEQAFAVRFEAGDAPIGNPEWPAPGELRAHDWCTHVPGVLRECWNDLSNQAKQAIYLMAKELADREEWE